jgi:hypothetical protein
MSLLSIIEELSTSPRHQEDEYEYTTDFIEWFYRNMYKYSEICVGSTLQRITYEPQFMDMIELCRRLINVEYAKNLDDESIIEANEDMKNWLISAVKVYSPKDELPEEESVKEESTNE